MLSLSPENNKQVFSTNSPVKNGRGSFQPIQEERKEDSECNDTLMSNKNVCMYVKQL